ncbi:MAG: hypothetical protein JJU11_11055 [Candidatus Sumerlaeia bacterium]|nr:hypothetical protein [Candidatus Sumerlaeia bacterium]
MTDSQPGKTSHTTKEVAADDLSGQVRHLLGPKAGEEVEQSRDPLRPCDQHLIGELVELCSEQGRGDLLDRIVTQRESLNHLNESMGGYPSPLSSSQLGGQRRDVQTLLDRLTRQNFFSIDLVIPTRAIISSATNMARLNFFRMLHHVASELADSGTPVSDEHRVTIEEGIADSIGLRAAEEILRSIICRDDAERIVRERAALLILHLWHDFNSSATRDLLPMLFHTWQARRRVRPIMGTLLGASELFSLLANGCDGRFIDFLNREDCSDEQVTAFQEFLFGLSSEELEGLRHSKGSEMVSIDELRSETPSSTDTLSMGLLVAGDRAERFYLFFMKRHIHAMNRALKDLPGPKQTAEQYVLEHLIKNQWELFSAE